MLNEKQEKDLEKVSSLSELRDRLADIRMSKRSKLQVARKTLNQQIYKQMRIKDGAENLMQAIKDSKDKKAKDNVWMELSFTTSRLHVLQEELQELNSSLQEYQGKSASQNQIPMIPLALREAKEINFMMPFKDFILEHYSEDGENYEAEINTFMDLRKNIRGVERSEAGIQKLTEYYNQLQHVEKRFFYKNRCQGIFFTWYDSITGIPKTQRSIAFEKASVAFNIGAVWTQIGANQDRASIEGIQEAITNFQKAAGLFKFMRETFANAPSLDMVAETSEMFSSLMMAQVQECFWEKRVLEGSHAQPQGYFSMAQEAVEVSKWYKQTHILTTTEPVKNQYPLAWSVLILVKSLYYKALSHYYTALVLLEENGVLPAEILQTQDLSNNVLHSTVKHTDPRKKLAKGHLSVCLKIFDEARRCFTKCKYLKKLNLVQIILIECYETAQSKMNDIDVEDDFTALEAVRAVRGSSKEKGTITTPNFHHAHVDDIFQGIGPTVLFNAGIVISPPRTAVLLKRDTGFGFHVVGGAPVMVQFVEHNSAAKDAGMLEGDVIISMNSQDVRWIEHKELVEKVKESGDTLTLSLSTPSYVRDTVEQQPFLDPSDAKDNSDTRSIKSMYITNPGKKTPTQNTKSKGKSKRPLSMFVDNGSALSTPQSTIGRSEGSHPLSLYDSVSYGPNTPVLHRSSSSKDKPDSPLFRKGRKPINRPFSMHEETATGHYTSTSKTWQFSANSMTD